MQPLKHDSDVELGLQQSLQPFKRICMTVLDLNKVGHNSLH